MRLRKVLAKNVCQNNDKRSLLLNGFFLIIPLKVYAMAESEVKKLEIELKQAFDQGRISGMQLKAEHQKPLTPSELAKVLKESGLPCIGGSWQEIEAGIWELRRIPCQRDNIHLCHVWRESVDGLVMGAGESARYSRYRNFEDPGSECVDVLYPESESQWRWDQFPEAHLNLLETLKTQLSEHLAEFVFLGYAESKIYYRLIDHHPNLSGHRQGFLTHSLQTMLSKENSKLELCEMSPRAVWQGEFS